MILGWAGRVGLGQGLAGCGRGGSADVVVGVSGGSGRGWSRQAAALGRGQRKGLEAGERGGQGVSPGPAGVDPEEQPALSVGEPGGDVEQLVAQRPGFGAGQVPVEQGGLGPGDQVAGDQGQLEPGLVDPCIRGTADG